MFQDMTNKLNASMEPIKELMEIQTRMLERLTKQQIECAQACMKETMNQTRELQNCGSAQELIELQQQYTQMVEKQLAEASSANLKAFNEARDAIEKVTHDAFDAFAPKR